MSRLSYNEQTRADLDSAGALIATDLATNKTSQISADVSKILYLNNKFILFEKTKKTTVQETTYTVNDVLTSLAVYLYMNVDAFKSYDPYELYTTLKSDFAVQYPLQTLDNAEAYYTSLTGLNYVPSDSSTTDAEKDVTETYYSEIQSPKPVLLGSSQYIITKSDSDNSACVYIDSDGGIFMVKPGAEPNKIASTENPSNTSLFGGTEDGRVVAWSVLNGSDTEIYMCDSLGAAKIDTLKDQNYAYATTYCNAKNDTLYIISLNSEYLYTVTDKQGAKTLFLGGEANYTLANPQKTLTHADTIESLSNLYVCARTPDSEDYDDNTLYYLDANGEREKVIENINYDFEIVNGKLFYISNQDDTLFACDISGAKIGDKEKIALDVASFKISSDGKTIYYLADENSDTYLGTLYQYVSGKSPEKISDSVKSYDFYGSADGKTVAYIKNPAEMGGEASYMEAGDLFIKSEGKESEKLAGGVIYFSSYLKESYDTIVSDDIYYLKDCAAFKDVGDTSEVSIKGTLCVYNGKESKVLAENVVE